MFVVFCWFVDSTQFFIYIYALFVVAVRMAQGYLIIIVLLIILFLLFLLASTEIKNEKEITELLKRGLV